MYKIRSYKNLSSKKTIEHSLINYRNKFIKKAQMMDEETLEESSEESLLDSDILEDINTVVEGLKGEFNLDLSSLKKTVEKYMESFSEIESTFQGKDIELDTALEEDMDVSLEKAASLKKKAFLESIKGLIGSVANPIQVVKNYYFMIKHILSDAPLHQKAIAMSASLIGGGVLLISPVDVIPDVIPLLGQIDDIGMFSLIYRKAAELMGSEEGQELDQKIEDKRGVLEKLFGFFDKDEDMAFDKYSGDISHLKKLIKLANKLDVEGKHKEADEFDKIIKKYFNR